MMRTCFLAMAAFAATAYFSGSASAQYNFGSTGTVITPSANTVARAGTTIPTIPTQGTGFKLMDYLPKFGGVTNSRKVVYTTFPDQAHMPGLDYMKAFNLQAPTAPK